MAMGTDCFLMKRSVFLGPLVCKVEDKIKEDGLNDVGRRKDQMRLESKGRGRLDVVWKDGQALSKSHPQL
jgi:hypothetical protein